MRSAVSKKENPWKAEVALATMRCLSHALLVRFLGLSSRYVSVRLRQIPVLCPKESAPRQSFSTGSGLVTAAEVVKYWQKVFETNRIPEARESSEYIVSFVLGAKTVKMPVQYILGEWDFQDLTLKMRPPVFIPRPETEENNVHATVILEPVPSPCQHSGGIVFLWSDGEEVIWTGRSKGQDRAIWQHLAAGAASALDWKATFAQGCDDLVSLVVQEGSWQHEEENSGLLCAAAACRPVILEVGCGSGAVALSLLRRLPQSRVIAVDKEKAAVDLTRENAQRLQLQDRIHILHHDVSSCSAEQLLTWGRVDFIVSNPPYIFHEDMATLAPEIFCYEDLDALDGGNDGMRVITTILTLAPSLLKDSGSVFLEVDPRHPGMVENWLRRHPELLLTLCAVHKDFCDKPRFLHILKQGS